MSTESPAAKRNRAISDKLRRKNRRYLRYITEYGQRFADSYKAVCNVLPKHSKQRFLELKIEYVWKKYGTRLTRKTLPRIEALNRVAGLKLLEFGWSCMACSDHTTSEWLFDIDHIIPSSSGGPNTYSNLQILCPTCHQKKHRELDGFTSIQSFKVATDSMKRGFDKNYHGKKD